jgi:tetratricopeptide (TPR) repeat protein
MTEARYGLAAARLQLADTAGALAQYRAVIASDTSGEEDLFIDRSRIMMARLVARAGERDAGLEILASIVARRRDEIAAEARLLRAELLSGAGDISGALSELKILTTELATYTEFYERGLLMLGSVYEQLTNYSAARETYTKLITETTDPKLKADAEARIKKLKK